MWVYVSGPAGPKSQGIYVMRFDPAAGTLSQPVLAANVKHASYFWLHPNGKCLYSVDSVQEDGKSKGVIRAYGIEDGTGKLVDLNVQPTGGVGPCYVSLDREGKFALAANYASGGVAVLPVRIDGKLDGVSAYVQFEGSGPNPKRQTHPYAHCFDFDPAGKFALACDLGTDQVRVFKFDRDGGKLEAAGVGKVPPGSGPRHVTFSADAKFAYVVNEMGSTITVFAYDGQTGAMKELQTISSLPPDYEHSPDKDTAAEVFIHPNGKWLYASNRGHNSVVRFMRDETTGKLSEPVWAQSGGRIPRYFGIVPGGKWMLVANEGSGNVLVFKINQQDGTITPTGDQIEIGSAMCIKFLVN
ncbi:MAG TPA: lactonase family protein [Tepidisphaeraceae bacterium]|nr:lactonase family protein [Tepidisphaeraceae bacterium]